MEQIILPNAKDPKYTEVPFELELGREYKITVYYIGDYVGTIEEVTLSSIVVTNLRAIGDAPVLNTYTVKNKDKAIFPTEEIYEIVEV